MRRSLQEGLDRSLADRVVWTGFIEDETVLASLFREADAFVLPARRSPGRSL
jgi:glycosyltransferase involved in cell wall biosynthesis